MCAFGHRKIHVCSSHYASKIAVCVAVSSHGVIGPILFDQTVNSELYLIILRYTVVIARWGYTTHNKFCFGHPARHLRYDCGQKPVRFLTLGYLEEKVYKKISVLQLRALIVQMCGKFAEDMCRRLITGHSCL